MAAPHTRSASRTRPRPGARPGDHHILDDELQPTAGQWLTLVLAFTFLVVGVAGLAVNGFNDWFDHDTGETVLGFEVNPFHDLVHLAFGVVGLVAWRTAAWSRAYGVALAVGYGAAVVYGIAALGEAWDVLSLNAADSWLHAGLAVAGLAVALLSRRPTSRPVRYERD